MDRHAPATVVQLRSRATRTAGFTLIEVLIALAITAILSSLAVSQYLSYVSEARIHTAIQDIRSIELVLDDRFLDNAPPASLADVGIDMRDPWGNPYRYLWLRNNPDPGLAGKRRRDKFMNPVNSDYDLYSMGEDGRTSAQFTAARARDDIVRANDGGYIGLARDH